VGRYLVGDEDFRYKYVFGEQPSNLANLAMESGAGTSSLAVRISDGDDDHFYADLVEEAKTKQIELPSRLPTRDSLVPIPMEIEPYDYFESTVVPLLERDAPGLRTLLGMKKEEEIQITSGAVYELRCQEWPILMAWVNSYLPTPLSLTLDELSTCVSDEEEVSGNEKVAQALEHLYQHKDLELLPYMALHILTHAVVHGVLEMSVEEMDGEWEATLE
jgi:hypothetical protein